MGAIIHEPIVQGSFSGDHCLGGNAITRGQLSWEAIVLGAICPLIYLSRGQLSGRNYLGAIIRGYCPVVGNYPEGQVSRAGNCPGQQLSGGQLP